jgi:hypothetical protein
LSLVCTAMKAICLLLVIVTIASGDPSAPADKSDIADLKEEIQGATIVLDDQGRTRHQATRDALKKLFGDKEDVLKTIRLAMKYQHGNITASLVESFKRSETALAIGFFQLSVLIAYVLILSIVAIVKKLQKQNAEKLEVQHAEMFDVLEKRFEERKREERRQKDGGKRLKSGGSTA